MTKTRCDWSGPICMTDKECDRLVGASFVMGDGTILDYPKAEISWGPDGYTVEGRAIGWPISMSPVIEPGREIVVRLGCSRRLGHGGQHGSPPLRRVWRDARRRLRLMRRAISRR